MAETENGTHQTELNITPEEARRIASLLRYAVSLNTTVGLLSPTERRLATSTYRATELAAQILEGKTFEEAVEDSRETWTGSLERDHRRALELLENTREELRRAMTGCLTPEQTAEFMEVTQEQFLELVKTGAHRSVKPNRTPKSDPLEK